MLVGIENTQRRRDMTGPTSVESDRQTAPNIGGSAAFRGFISEELVPHIEGRYAVNQQRAVIGESLTGLFIIETLFVQPELFETYIAIDPSVWWNGEQWPREAGTRLASLVGSKFRLLLTSAGKQGNGLEVDRMAQTLCSHPQEGFSWSYLPRPELRHDNIYRSTERILLEQAFSGKPLAKPDCTPAH
jgi:predicted alpha/beta superfamily hydrolase